MTEKCLDLKILKFSSGEIKATKPKKQKGFRKY